MLADDLLAKGDTTRAVEAVHKGLSLVPSEKLPNDYFTISLAEVLVKAGKIEEGEKLFREIVVYSDSYLDYIIGMKAQDRYGLDYSTGINMQTMLDLYNMSLSLKADSLTRVVEPMINNYYGILYSRK